MTKFNAKMLLVQVMVLALVPAIGLAAEGPETPKSDSQPSLVRLDSLPISPGDTIHVQFFDDASMDQPHLRVTDDGQVPLLFLGPLKVSGLTPDRAAQLVADQYMNKNILRNAHVAITVETYASSTVTIYGFVNGATPTGSNGVTVTVPGPKPLLTVLAMAGGLTDRASHTITIQRADPAIKPFTVPIPDNNATAALAAQTLIFPGDTVIVPRAGVVYILGDVGRPTGVVMAEDGKISLMEALSQAGSPLPNAKLTKIMLFRKSDGDYHPVRINFEDITRGKKPDLQLEAEDVIWVPFSMTKNMLVNGSSIAASLGAATASALIYTH